MTAKICEKCKKWIISPLSDKYCSECRYVEQTRVEGESDAENEYKYQQISRTFREDVLGEEEDW
ncbi:MAG: hypothetical protein ACFFDT_00245 [Candidatus Hodarchaeota archaeon]